MEETGTLNSPKSTQSRVFNNGLRDSVSSEREEQCLSPPLGFRKDACTRAVDRARPKKTRSRDKYVAKACLDCQRRKVKCSGDDVCVQCQARDARCVYIPKAASEGRRQRVTNKQNKRRRTGLPSTLSKQQPFVEAVPERDSVTSVLLERLRVLEEKMGQMDDLLQLAADLPGSTSPTSHSSMAMLLDKPHSDTASIRPYAPASAKRTILPVTASLSHSTSSAGYNSPETDTFDPNSSEPISLSLSSQLRSLREISASSPDTETSFSPSHGKVRCNGSLQLPVPAQLHHQLDLFFRDYNCWFPYMNEGTTMSRINRLLGETDYGEESCTFYVNDRQVPLMAVLCNMLAIAAVLDSEEAVRQDSKSGWLMYIQGVRLIRRWSSSQINLDLVRYYTMSACYLLMSEYLSAATEMISKAYQLAAKLKINDQSAWSDFSKEERLDRQKLWCVIYFMDRRISQKNGTAYLIRDNEVAVEDFTNEEENYTANASDVMAKSASGDHGHPSDDPNVYVYLQILVNLGKLWGQIWDAFFAVRTGKSGDRQEIELMDTRILFLQKCLPSQFTWDAETTRTFAGTSETETHIRRRLGIYVRINLLRMIIRHNPLARSIPDGRTSQICADLAIATIEAISAFVGLFPFSRPSAYFNTASLVECIYQLVPLLRAPRLSETHQLALGALRKAKGLLSGLTRLTEGAVHVLYTLDAIIGDGEQVISSNDADGGSESSFALLKGLQRDRQIPGDGQPFLPFVDDALDQDLLVPSDFMSSQLQPEELSTLTQPSSGNEIAGFGSFDSFNLASFSGADFGHPFYDIGLDLGRVNPLGPDANSNHPFDSRYI